MIAMHLFGHGKHKEWNSPTDINNEDKSAKGDDVE